MNKNKKIAMAVVSVVMAGTMVGSLAGCTDNDTPGGENSVASYGRRVATISSTSHNASKFATKEVGEYTLAVSEDDDTKLVYSTNTSLNINVCDSSNTDRHISYHPDQISASAVMPDNYSYFAGDLKPAWWQMSQTLGLKFVDKAQDRSSSAQITDMIKYNETSQYQIVTGSGSSITNNSTYFLDLNQFIDYMPNYKAFLNENEIVKWSLTSDTETGAMYYAPYFDGNNDIEKYCIVHREWVRAMLDMDVSAATTKWKESKTGKSDVGTEQVYAESFMGTEGSYTIDTTDPTDESRTVVVKVNYDAAKTAANTASTPLNNAIKAAYSGFTSVTSGNIVDIQNAVINGTSGEVTGAQLLDILRAYIDVAYQDADGNKFYSTRSDVFNAEYAAWDVDLFTALSRCAVTSYKLFGGKIASDATANQIYALAGRQGTTQRRVDLNSLAGELYGVRGLESRNEYLYVDQDGNLHDARGEAASYDAMNRLSALSKEGLIYTGTANADKVYASSSTILPLMLHDYSQTQTTDGFYVQGIEGLTNENIISSGDLKFDFAPILTPVSRWDVNGDGTAETVMRFTESWRAVKNTGFCVPKDAVSNPQVLSATLTFIDYLFSNDGQIVATYGPMSSKGNATGDTAPDGFWYANEVTNVSLDTVAEKYEGSDQYHVKEAYKSQYFVFENKVYTGTTYLDRQVPSMTTNSLNYYYGLTVNGHYLGEGAAANGGIGYITTSPARNYTNYARGVVGSALPIGNKDQGFEYQGTADCGLDGTAVVSKAVANGTIKHLTQEVNSDTYWYTCVPTTLPVDSTDGTTLEGHTDITGSDTEAGLFLNTSKTAYRTNLYLDLLFYGYGANKDVAGNDTWGKIPANGAACVTLVNEHKLNERLPIYSKGWEALKTHYGK